MGEGNKKLSARKSVSLAKCQFLPKFVREETREFRWLSRKPRVRRQKRSWKSRKSSERHSSKCLLLSYLGNNCSVLGCFQGPAMVNSNIRLIQPMTDMPETANGNESLVRNSSLYREFQAEREEILKHKWIESEKLGYDIGFEHALTDWIIKHRAKWRKSRQAPAHQTN